MGGLASVGTVTILVGTIKFTSNKIRPRKKIKDTTEPVNKDNVISDSDTEVLGSVKEIFKAKEEFAYTLNDDGNDVDFMEMDKLWNMQKLYIMILDFMFKYRDIKLSDLKEQCILEYDTISSNNKDGQYGDKNQIIDDYLVFLQLLKDKKELN